MKPLPFVARLVFAYVAFFRVLFDGMFAARVKTLGIGEPAAVRADGGSERGAEKITGEQSAAPEKLPTGPVHGAPVPSEISPKKSEKYDVSSAYILLALLQQEGRLIDFLEQDIDAFSDADVGSAARLVHSGSRKVLRSRGVLGPVRSEDEGARVRIDSTDALAHIKLIGNVSSKPPYSGVLRHRGWKLTDLVLPTMAEPSELTILAPAELEL